MVRRLSAGGKRIRTFGSAALQADPISAVCDYDFAEMPATFGNFVAASNRWSAAMPQPNDLSRSLVALDQNSTIGAAASLAKFLF
jgi:hypothetical protein